MILSLTLMLAGGPGAAPPAPAIDRPIAVVARPLSADAMLASAERRVRSGNMRITKLLSDGVRRSRTFADLVTALHQTNVIVYVEPSNTLAPEIAGRILLQAVAGAQRYLRVQVRATLPGDQMISVIAHELRHALEVADDPAVVDDHGLMVLYRRIGHVTYGADGFDTDAARETGKRVRNELMG
ncbi:MAG: hypothetical protein ACRD1U_14815 [Vicinamibacterales bacterium]